MDTNLLFLILFNILIFANSTLVNRRVQRKINLEKHFTKIDTLLTILNTGEKPISKITLKPDPTLKKLSTFLVTQKGHTGLIWLDPATWQANLPNPVEPDGTIDLVLEEIYTHTTEPFPIKIKQNHDQLMRYKGNLHHFSPYVTRRELVTVTCPSDTIISYKPTENAKKSSKVVTYDMFKDIPSDSNELIDYHYQANIPFITTHYLLREIEVSHWGNVAVKDNAEVRHVGAKLDGSFSRVQYAQDGGDDSSRGHWVSKLVAKLSPSVQNVIYRDAIGNISTSRLRKHRDRVEVEIKPRTPLFGGWKSDYTLGFNLPSEKALFYNKNDNTKFTLKLKAIDELYSNQVVDQVEIDIILPEGATDVNVKIPAGYTRAHDEVKYSYLDMVTGRPVIKLRAENLAGKSLDQMLELTYIYPASAIFREPLMTFVFFIMIFIFVMFIVRLDLTIGDDGSSDIKERISAAYMIAQEANKKRISSQNQYQQALNRYKETKDLPLFTEKQKAYKAQIICFKSSITEVIAEHKEVIGEKLEAVLGIISSLNEAVGRGENGLSKLKEADQKINVMLEN